MNYNNYNFTCLITSILMLIILITKFKNINLCFILLFGAIFSIIWRSIKLVEGENKIELDENGNKNIKKFIILTFLIFLLAWIMQFMNFNETSRDVHTLGHIYILIVFILTFYLYL